MSATPGPHRPGRGRPRLHAPDADPDPPPPRWLIAGHPYALRHYGPADAPPGAQELMPGVWVALEAA